MTWPLLPTDGAFKDWPRDPLGTSQRKESAAKRLRIFREDFRADIAERIRATHQEVEVQGRVSKFISVAVNPARDVTHAVAMAYDLGVRRVLNGATEEQNLAFSQLVAQTSASTKAPYWNRYAFLLGPTLIIPAVRRGQMTLDLIAPHVADILQDPEDPMGPPAAAAWSVNGAGETAFVILDKEEWVYTDARGAPLKREPHGLGYWPGAVMRLDEPLDGWWPTNWQERLVDGTITCAYVYAKMQWVRKSQNKKFLSFIGDTQSIPKGQMIDPELAFIADTRTANALQVEVFDFDTDPKFFLQEIRFTVEQLIESYGIPQSAVSFDVSPEGGLGAVVIQKEKLGAVRMAQVAFLTKGELALWPNVVDVARVSGHPLGRKLPPPDEVREMLTVEWPKLKVIDDPIKREELYAAQLKRGGVSPIDPLQEDNPHLTRDECRALMSQNLSEQAALIEEFTKRNLVMDLSSGLIASSEAMGKLGPIMRDGRPPATAPAVAPDAAGSSEA